MENRRQDRRKARFHGVVHLDADRPSIPCAVRDLSDQGARLSFLQPAEVPDRFRIVLTGTDETCTASVRWRRGREVGVEFLDRRANLDLSWAEPGP